MRTHIDNLYRHSFVRYLATGGTTFALDFGILILGREVFGLPVVVAATLSYWIALGYNFTLNKFWTFGVKEHTGRHGAFYIALVIINYLASIAIIWALGLVGIHYFVAKVISVGVLMLWNYIAYKKIIFT